MYCPWAHYTVTTRYMHCDHAFDVIVLAPSIMFQTYDITLYDVSYDYSHMPLHCLRNKRKEKDKLN